MRTTVALFILVIITIYYYQKARKVIKQKFKKMKTKHFKVKELPQVTEPNSIYFVKPDGCDAIAIFTTDKDGNAFQNKEIKSITLKEDRITNSLKQIVSRETAHGLDEVMITVPLYITTKAIYNISGYVEAIQDGILEIKVEYFVAPNRYPNLTYHLPVKQNEKLYFELKGKINAYAGTSKALIVFVTNTDVGNIVDGSTVTAEVIYSDHTNKWTEIELYSCEYNDVNTGSYSGSGSIIGNL